MVVKSPTVTITVEEIPKVYTLTISVTPKTGYVGDTFKFSGGLRWDAERISGATINLILAGTIVGSDVTDGLGLYSIDWRADRAGTLNFHSEAPALEAASETIVLEIPFIEVPVPWWMIAAVGGGLCITVVVTAVAVQEVERRRWR